MSVRLRDLFDEMSEEEFDEMIEEELETYIEDSVETFFRPLINQYEKEETYKNVYLNKYEVYNLIKNLADSSEPMVSAPTYDYYDINAGLLLEKIASMDGVMLEESDE